MHRQKQYENRNGNKRARGKDKEEEIITVSDRKYFRNFSFFYKIASAKSVQKEAEIMSCFPPLSPL
jgi:hypothetical protein